MHNSYHSSVMILSLTAIIVLSATLLFPLDSAFGQAISTNNDGTRLIYTSGSIGLDPQFTSFSYFV
ncbi:MAG: hypothetical protein R1F52_07320 [Candidatus Nitrosoabyssus spongiisocia]|nr:MAG: hypothetical protein R1F52_07320 [Nitrosopumilaceae archaeon AB1(1)]